MSLQLITGRANAGKSRFVREAMVEAVARGGSPVLLVPTRPDVERAREEIAGHVALGAEVTTFDRWVEGLWALHGDGRRLVPSVVRSAVASDVALASEAHVGAVARTPGFAELLSRIAARAVDGRPLSAHDTLEHGLVVALERYRDELNRLGLVEQSEVMAIIGSTQPISGATVVCNRFTDLSEAQTDLLVALSEHNEVVVAVAYETSFPATEATSDFVERLLGAGASVTHASTDPPTCELGALEAGLFRPETPIAPSGAVRLLEAAGAEAEAALVADGVAQLITEGFAPDRIAVCFRDLASRRALVESAFTARGVPVALDVAVPFARTPLGSALSALVGSVTGSGTRQDLLAFLHGPYSGLPAEDVAELDRRWRLKRIDSARTWMADVAAAGRGSADVLERAVRVVNQSVVSGNDWQSLVEAMLSNAGSRGGRAATEVRLDARAFSHIVAAATDLEAIGSTANAGTFLEILGRTPVSTGGAGDRGAVVEVTEVHRLRSRRFDAVVVGGLTAQEFSSEKREPLSAALLHRIGRSAGTDERLAERLLFYTVATRAKRHLVLARQATDASGGALRASVFWEEVLDLYRTAEDAATGEPSALRVWRALPLSRLEDAAPAYGADRAALRRRAARGEWAPPTTTRGRLARPEALTAKDAELSVTEIETYHECPYRWFYDRVISPGEIDREFSYREKGALAHAVLAEFYKKWGETGRARVTVESLADALSLFDVVAAGLLAEQRYRTHGLAEQIAAQAAVEWARSAIKRDAELLLGFAPWLHEWRFGDRFDEPVTLWGVRLKGAIDRIDRGPAGIVVTDYKSSDKGVHGHGAFGTHGSLQIPVYAAIAGERFGEDVVAGLYRSLAGMSIRGFWDAEACEPEAWVWSKDICGRDCIQEVLADARQKVTAAVEGMRSGCIEQRPRRSSSCTYCGAREACKEMCP